MALKNKTKQKNPQRVESKLARYYGNIFFCTRKISQESAVRKVLKRTKPSVLTRVCLTGWLTHHSHRCEPEPKLLANFLELLPK